MNKIVEVIKQELNEDEYTKYKKIKRIIRKRSHLSAEEKCECCICHIANEKEKIYNHHVMKVEYLALFGLIYDVYKDNYPVDDILLANIEDEFMYPRVAVCDKHHTIFHELNGDYMLNKALSLSLEEYESLYNVFVELDEFVYSEYSNSKKPAESTYLKVWNELVIRSIERMQFAIIVNKEFDDLNKYTVREQFIHTIKDFEEQVHKGKTLSEEYGYDEEFIMQDETKIMQEAEIRKEVDILLEIENEIEGKKIEDKQIVGLDELSANNDEELDDNQDESI